MQELFQEDCQRHRQKAKSRATPTKPRQLMPLAKQHRTSHRPSATAEIEHSQTLDVPMNIGVERGAMNVIDPLNTGSVPSSQEMDTTPTPELEFMQMPVTTEELYQNTELLPTPLESNNCRDIFVLYCRNGPTDLLLMSS